MKVLSSIGMKAALDRLALPYEFHFGTAAIIKRQIEGGEPFDLAILMPHMIDALKLRAPRVLAKSPMSVAVRSGARRPDLGSTAAFKRALLEAKSIAYSKEGHSGKYAAALIERLGLAQALAAKTVLETRPGAAAFNLAEGKAELALTIAAEIVPVPGAELAGPFPDEIGLWVEFAAGAAPRADATAVRSLIESIQSPEGAAALRAAGLEPA
jgi:molybdate transport system substrate-binding protein